MELDTSKYFLQAARLTEEDIHKPVVYTAAATDEFSSIGPEDALEDIVAEFREEEANAKAQERIVTLGKIVQLHHFAPTVDEFFRSYLLRNDFRDTLNSFQIEWFKKLHKGQLDVDHLEAVPHIYEQNEKLSDNLSRLQKEIEALRIKLESTEESKKKIQNERDYHMLKHRRLAQEKDQLIGELKRRINPLLDRLKATSPGLSRLVNRKLNENIRAHESACTSVTIHTEQPWLCTTGDDRSWKMWSTNTAALLVDKSNAHDSWIATADFHPTDELIATASGDGSVRLWKFELTPEDSLPEENKHTDNKSEIPGRTTNMKEAKHVGLLKHHTGAVWSVNWHWDGKILASAGLDSTVCLWDTTIASSDGMPRSKACRATLRKHCGSVNSVRFLPCGNILVSASTDRSVLLWDARTGINVHTFLGHQSSVSYAVFNQQGTCIASCDSSGVIRFWDLRQATALASFIPQHEVDGSSLLCAPTVLDLTKGRKKRLQLSVNQIMFDLSGDYLAAACSDGRVCYIEVPTGQISSLFAHEDAVQSVAFDLKTNILYSTSNDGHLCSWN
ncbi:unnamed protein product [Echinostoma caproni]|uniref:WD_REPEATS_REGION domain-containing protein n=1 Tax=Echinostoma caproni TaxID=27848 RepID=A0A183A9R3_9TREM|nr:unnamed protein product [Echinostoma caproni]